MSVMQDIRKQTRRRTPRMPAKKPPHAKYQTARNFAFDLGAKATGARKDERPASAGGTVGKPQPTWEQDLLVEFEPYLAQDGREGAPKPEGRVVEVLGIHGTVNVRTRSDCNIPFPGAQAGWLVSIHGRAPDVDPEGRNNFSDEAMLYVQGDVGEKIPSQTIVLPPGSWGVAEDGKIRVKAAVYMNEDPRMALHVEVSFHMDWRYK